MVSYAGRRTAHSELEIGGEMKKKIIITIGIITCISCIAALFLFRSSFLQEDPVYIALMAPMTGPESRDGIEMEKGVRLCLNEINESGGINGRRIELIVYDDKNDKRKGLDAAYDVGLKNLALLVIGHFYSSVSATTGNVYKKIGVPAITAYATANDVTLDNEWYFRIVPHNKIMAEFMVNYMSHILGKKSASIIYVQDSYGYSFKDTFEQRAEQEKVKIIKKWGITANIAKEGEQVRQVVEEIRALKEPGMLFFATPTRVAAEIISSIKFAGTNYSMIGPDGIVSGEYFLKKIHDHIEANEGIGIDMSDIYSAESFLMDIGGEKAFQFKKAYSKAFGEEPTSDVAACAYDALYVAVEAIKNAEIEGKGHIRSDRRKVRNALSDFHSYETGVSGVTGRIFFDRDGNVVKPPFFGMYEKNKLHPSFYQYSFSDTTATEDLLKKTLSGDLMTMDGIILNRTRVVNVGFQLNNIYNLNIKQGTYTLDFDLMFRYRGTFNDAAILFENAGELIILEKPVKEKTEDGMTTRVYHVKAPFNGNFDFHTYPFDHHDVTVRFKHATLTTDQLIYVPDAGNDREAKMIQNTGGTMIPVEGGWEIKKVSIYQNPVLRGSMFGESAFVDSEKTDAHSQFNIALQIERADHLFPLKQFIPVLTMISILYLSFFIPDGWLPIRTLIVVSLLTANLYFHFSMMSIMDLAYTSAVGIAFLTVYGLVVFAAAWGIFGYHMASRKGEKLQKLITIAAHIIYLLIVFGAAASIILPELS